VAWRFVPERSRIELVVRHMVITKVRGRFRRFSGELALDEGDLTRSSAKVAIEAASFDTGERERDEAVVSADFLDVQKFPTIDWVSRRVEGAGRGKLKVFGDLTIHGVTRGVALAVRVEEPPRAGRARFSAAAKISRKEFGLSWGRALEAGGLLVGDEVEIAIEVVAVS
jgi:polyisoprenoid-binding protein YceI